VARLSDPESLLRKLTDLGSHIDQFYETAELAKQIKDRLIQFYDTALQQEKQFELRNAEMENLKTGYEKKLPVLQEIISQSSDHLLRILTDLGYEKNAAAQSVKEISAVSVALQKQYKDSETFLSVTEKEVTGQMAWLWKEQETALWENRCLILRDLDENRAKTEKDSALLMLFSEQTQEEISYLAEQTAQWRENTEKRLYKERRAFESLKNLYEKAAQEIADTGRKYEMERAGLVDAFRTEKQSVQAVVEKLICERGIFRENLLLLEKEKAEILKEITGQIAWLSEQSAGFLRNAQYRISEQLDKSRNLVLADRENLSQFAQEMQEEILLHQSELESFAEQTKIRISRKIRDFDRMRSACGNLFQKLRGFAAHCDAQLLNLLTDLGFAKQNLHKTAQQLAGEYEQALQQHREIQQENQKILNAVTGQLAFAEKSLQENLAHIRIRAAQTADEHRIHMQNAWEELSSFSNEIREEIATLQKDAEKFLNQKAFALSRLAHALKMQAHDFRKGGMEKIEAYLAIETDNLHQRAAQEFEKLHTALEQENARLAHLTEHRIDQGLSELSVIKEEIRHQIQWFRQMWEQWEAFCKQADMGLADLRKVMLCSDRDFMEIRTDFAYEKMQIHEQIRQLEQQRADVQDQQRKSQHFLAEYLREITEQISYQSSQLLQKFQENEYRIAQQMDEHRQMTEQEKAGFSLRSDQMQEEMLHLADEMEKFRNETLAHLNHRYRKLSYRHEQFWQSLSKEIRNIFSEQSQKLHTAAESDRKEMVLHFHENFEAVLQDIRTRFVQEMEECKTSARKETEDISLSFLHAQQEITHLKENFTDFQQKIFSDTDQKISALSAQYQEFRESFPKELHGNLNEKLTGFQQKILADTEQKISELSVMQNQLRETIAMELQGNFNEKLTGFQEKILLETDQKLSNLSAQYQQLRETIAMELQGNLNEKFTGFQQKIFSDTEQKISDLSSQSQQLRETIAMELQGNLNEKFTGFQQKILADTDQKISALSEKQVQLRQAVAKELEKRFSQMGKQETSGQEKERIDAALALLESEKNGILQHQKSLAQKLDHMDTETRQAVAGIRQYAEKEIKLFSGQLDTAKKEIGDTKKQLGTFAEQIKEKLRTDNEKQLAQQADFRKKIVAALIARLGEDLRKLQDQDEINQRECREEIRKSDKNLLQNMENLEAGMAENLEQIKAEQEKIVSFVRKNVGTMAERQKSQGEALRELGERIKAIEDFLKSRVRKG